MKFNAQTKITWFASAALVLCFAASVFCVRAVERSEREAATAETLVIPSAKVLKRMSLGYDGLLADIYWTRAVQYFGDLHRVRATGYPLLANLLDITTELDPHLEIAYRFGAMFLAQKPPQGAGDPHKAVELVEKGIRENPDSWRLYFDLGFINSMELKDYAAAANAFERGSHVPGAHPALKVMAASMAQHGGDTATARYLWLSIYQSSDNKMLKNNALQHLRSMTADEDMAELERLARVFRDHNGRFPNGIGELVAAGVLRGVPVDPVGRPYRLQPDGTVMLQSLDELPFTMLGRPPDAPSKDVSTLSPGS
jgi:hypothetical protein